MSVAVFELTRKSCSGSIWPPSGARVLSMLYLRHWLPRTKRTCQRNPGYARQPSAIGHFDGHGCVLRYDCWRQTIIVTLSFTAWAEARLSFEGGRSSAILCSGCCWFTAVTGQAIMGERLNEVISGRPIYTLRCKRSESRQHYFYLWN